MEGGADGHADDGRLGQGHVDHPVLAELGDQPVGGLEHTAPVADVLPEDEDPFVGRHGAPDGLADRVDEGPDRSVGLHLLPVLLRQDDPVLAGGELGRHPGHRPQRPGEDLAEGGRRFGRRRRLGALDGLFDLGRHVRLHLGLLGLRQESLLDEVLLEPLERVLLPPRLDLLGHAVGAVVIVGGVGQVAVGLALDEARPFTLAGPVDRGVHRGVDVERVVAVDDHPQAAVLVGVLGDVLHRRLLDQRHGDGVAVVLAHRHQRQVVDAGEVHRLVEVALAGGAVAEVTDDDRVLTPHPGGQGDAGGVGDVGGDR